MPYLEVRGVTKSFGGTQVLSNCAIAVEQGTFVTLLGPSGCGKTTMLRIIAGLEKPDTGEVYLEGVDITAWPPHRRNIGMVFQSYALFPNLNVFGNVAFGLWARGVDARTARQTVLELLELVGLSGLERRFPHELSGGQQQRVALARALAPKPKVLLLDEPLSAVDAAFRAKLREELRRIQRSLGITTILVTHDQEEALSISDRVIVMRAGRVEQEGSPEEIYRFPVNHFVARFVGASNLFTVTRDVASGKCFFQGHSIVLPPVSLNGERRVILHVRPESLRLVKKDASYPRGCNSNVLPGRILWRTFFGAMTRFEVAVGEAVLSVDVPSDNAGLWREGEEVCVLFDPNESKVFREEGGNHDYLGIPV